VPVRFGHYEFDAARRRLTRQGSPVHLTPLAFTLLELLVTGAPRVFTKKELHDRLWPDSFVSDASLTSLIKELRRALDDQGDRAIISTVHGVGYAFEGRSCPRRRRRGRGRSLSFIGSSTTHAGCGCMPARTSSAGRPMRRSGSTSETFRDATPRLLSRRRPAKLHDLGSKNGTRANDRLITGPTGINDGDRIGVGDVTLVYRCAAGGPPTESQVP
jgi:DNA-binding winged helix-turn-helix (wHTH) protein